MEHKIKLTLKETLEKYDISMNNLAQTGSIRYPTIHDMCAHPHRVKQVNFSTLSRLVETLRELAGDDQIDVTDVFKFKDD